MKEKIEDFLRVPSCPLWLIKTPTQVWTAIPHKDPSRVLILPVLQIRVRGLCLTASLLPLPRAVKQKTDDNDNGSRHPLRHEYSPREGSHV
jgi:hypothetical protein